MSADLLIAAGGIAALALLSWFLGFWRPAAFAHLKDAEEALRALEPGAGVAEATLSADRKAALMRLGDGRVAILTRQGDRFSGRILAKALPTRVQGARINLPRVDPGFPSRVIVLASEEAAAHWRDVLSGGGRGDG